MTPSAALDAPLDAAAVRRAAVILGGAVARTPLLRNAALDAIAGCELWLKCENLQHVAAFKARGALYAAARLGAEERARGLITYSSGNHGQAVALAAQRHGVPCTVVMPHDAPAVKARAVAALGARVVFAGHTSAERRAEALALQGQSGAALIPPFDHPHVIAGQGTATLELAEQLAERGSPPLDALLVPVGGGGLVAGACLASEGSATRVYAVEPRGCDSLARSLATGVRVPVVPGPSLADGLRPVEVGALPFEIARTRLAGALLVDDDDIGTALTTLLFAAKLLVEPSGAAALAPALLRRLPHSPKRVGVILSGGNVDRVALAALITRYPPLEAG